MGSSTERSRSLHNFTLPIPKWGSFKYLRCVKQDFNQSFYKNLIRKSDLRKKRLSKEEVAEDDDFAKPWNLRSRRAAAAGFVEEGMVVKEEKTRVELSVSLSKEEIEHDFVAILGIRPSKRPKKRTKIVQNHLDSIFPGLWLKQVTADTYKVADIAES